jgi:membrane-associated protein
MTAYELLAWIADNDQWVYALLLAYAFGKTGPLPLVAGYVSALGALQAPMAILAVLVGSVMGSQLRFAIGRYGSPWLFERFPRFAPWMAMGAAGVDRYRLLLLPLYRFAKGAYSLIGLGAGASRLAWRRFVLFDTAGALLWSTVSVGLGVAIGRLGYALEPRWAAYVGLGLLVLGMVVVAVSGARLKRILLPFATEALLAARARRARTSAT